jgi:hypothetical protein
MKKLLFAIAAIALLVSCQNNTANEQTNQVAETVVVETIDVQLKDFDDKAGEMVGKQIALLGTIDHVCKHGGQKMFMVNQDSDARVKITTGEDMAAFNTELEGENVKVLGVVDELRIDEEYLREWEEELKAEQKSEAGEQVHMGEGEGEGEDHHEGDNSQEYEQINKYRQMIQESEKDYISFFSVVCVEYKVIEKGV